MARPIRSGAPAPRRPQDAAQSPICCALSAPIAIACPIRALSTTTMARRGFRRQRWPFRTPTVHENAPSWNVVGEVKGAERPDECVLIGGHPDSWDLGTGATDDGAGIAIAFGAARLIAGLPTRPSRTIRIVLFGAEEMDFSGAAYAKAHEGEIGKIVVAS